MLPLRHDILPGFKPDNSGDVFKQPSSVLHTNNIFDVYQLIFNDTDTKIGGSGKFYVPNNYVGTAKLIIVWHSSVITGNFVANFEYRAIGGNDLETFDPATVQEAVAVTDVAGGTTLYRMETSIALTSANFEKLNSVHYNFYRNGITEGAGGIAAPVIVDELYFEYDDV